jgi:hypothetical protein
MLVAVLLAALLWYEWLLLNCYMTAAAAVRHPRDVVEGTSIISLSTRGKVTFE